MQEKNVENFVSELVERYPKLIVVRKEIEESYECLKRLSKRWETFDCREWWKLCGFRTYRR